MDVDAAVAAQQAPHVQLQGDRAARTGAAWRLDFQHGVPATRAADVHAAELLRVEVQHPRGGHHPAVQPERAGQTRLLVHGEERLYRRQLGVGSHLQNRQRRSDSNAVVGPERGACGLQPFAIHPEPDGVGGKVMRRARVLLADHVDVTLEHDGVCVLAAPASRTDDQEVPAGILPPSESLGLCKLPDVAQHLLFLLRRPRNAAEAGEVAPERGGLAQGQDGLRVARHGAPTGAAAQEASPPRGAPCGRGRC
mmetsp:Transcript_108281/g.334397  ORF Transcript_108281/g.334397 Transcript_108281/m.334397 type:complete len:252 (-) Transcript_108281:13-768(-)